jgi:carbon-monoxide dehydrogenase large subunit
MTEVETVKWIGKSVVRQREDGPLTAGAGRFMADINLPGMLHMAILRSVHAHARLLSINTEAAESHPAVHAVFTGKDMPEALRPLPVIWNLPGQKESGIPALASEKVRYVGEPVAVVVADSPSAAEDARELIEVEYEQLPAIVTPQQGAEPGATVINEDWGDNIAARYDFKTGDTDAAFANAPVVVKGRFHINRHTAVPMETRGNVASWDSLSGTLTLWSGSQAPSLLRTELADSLGLADNAIRILSPNVGGAFGVKWDRYPEDILICVVAQKVGCPVKWIEDRREHFQATSHAREQFHEWELAATEDGKILGVRGTIMPDVGASLPSAGIGTHWVTGCTVPNQYKYENYSAELVCVATNKVPSGSYRGFGGPEGNFASERLMDKLARRLELDPAEVRRRNQIQSADMPYASPSGTAFYDSGDPPEALRMALERVGYDELRREQAELREQGIYRGIGIGCYVHCTGFAPSPLLGSINYNTSGYEGVRVQIDPGGKVTLYTGMVPIGQGTETTLAQVAADAFGIDMAEVRVVWGDTSQTPYTGFGSGGSRSHLAVVALLNATDVLKAKMIRIAAHHLEANTDDVEFVNGAAGVRGAPSTRLTLRELGRIAHLAHNLPPHEEPTLHAFQVFDPPGLEWGYGCHIGVIDVDIETATTKWVRYVIVDDCGEVINPLIVKGQVHGAIAQGIGGALLEELTYDESGQLLTGSFMDYLMPSFHDVPKYELDHIITPAPNIRGGFKGVGEAGCMATASVVANAVTDALSPFGIEVDALPVTPNSLWRLLRDAGAYPSPADAAM